ncbi:E2/UBC family protein [Thermoproteota archaeon]
MQERIIQEIGLLKEKYPNLALGQDYDWAMIPDFPLPEGYNRNATKLLFLIPKTYPHVAPDCFYVETGLRLTNGNMPSNYNEYMDVPVGGTWGYFSWHQEIWQSVDEIQKGDNLLSFIKSVNLRLREAD